MSSGLVRLWPLGILASTIALTSPVWAEFPAPPQVPAPAVVPAPPTDAALSAAITTWERLRGGSSVPSFAELSQFLRAHPSWPQEEELRRRAERMIATDTPFADRIAYFEKFPPLSGVAKFRLAEAWLATGRSAEAGRLAREAWTSDSLNMAVEPELLTRFGPMLTPADHAARVDRLLWADGITAARRVLRYLPADQRALAEARIALKEARRAYSDMSARARAEQLYAQVPAALRNDPGLVLDRAGYLRDIGNPVTARQLMVQMVIAPGAAANPEKWMEERLTLARDAARDGQYELAYRIAANHNAFPLGVPLTSYSLSERDDFTSLEWLAGWTALKQLRRPSLAVRHFENFRNASKTPASQSRGDYWAARAAEAAGDRVQVQRFLESASRHLDHYYGQLALERLGRPIMLPTTQPVVATAEARQRFEANELVRAAKLLGRMGDRTRQGIFMRALVEQATTPEQMRLVADLAPQIGRPELGVLIGKAARLGGQFGLIDAAYPKLSLERSLDGDWTMIHAIARQESQFDREAVSAANARGLMQLMPGTARETASRAGLPYDYSRLTADTTYNVMLGSTYYRSLLDRYGGNHVLAVAAYNAGPGNVNKWISANGDPRSPSVDVVEWVEAIPYMETRNYVQRVLENAVVYDLMHARTSMQQDTLLSAYLGRRQVR